MIESETGVRTIVADCDSRFLSVCSSIRRRDERGDQWLGDVNRLALVSCLRDIMTDSQ